METLLNKAQKFIALTLAILLILVVVLATVHLGVLIAEEIWKPPRFLIPVQGLLDVFAFFLLVLIAMARKVIIVEPDGIPGMTLLGIAAIILALGVAFYFERQTQKENSSAH